MCVLLRKTVCNIVFIDDEREKKKKCMCERESK